VSPRGRTAAAVVRRWQQAASFAARAHRHQLRKDQETPYLAHPVRVALTVLLVFGCDDAVVVSAALLHDTIEDTGTDYDDLLGLCGKPVADCVAALTKNMSLPEESREREYDLRLARADWRARLVKLADQYDNYSEVLHSGLVDRRKAAAKCRRALKLAAPDARHRPETRRAVAALRDLLRSRLRD